MANGKNKGIDYEAAGHPRPTGANYLLAIAINKYEYHPQLSNCVRDAKQLVKVLQEKYGFQPDHTVTLFDQEATSANLYARLLELIQKVKPQDNVVTYFSGHGFYDRSDLKRFIEKIVIFRKNETKDYLIRGVHSQVTNKK
ncbi:MAG: caspase family protein [Phaeodactylibacter sp.]|nr:caspase family protein [Phaeodactylibacter sp.]